jgi:hypothetical protein
MIKSIFQIVKYVFGNLDIETFNSHNDPPLCEAAISTRGSEIGNLGRRFGRPACWVHVPVVIASSNPNGYCL